MEVPLPSISRSRSTEQKDPDGTRILSEKALIRSLIEFIIAILLQTIVNYSTLFLQSLQMTSIIYLLYIINIINIIIYYLNDIYYVLMRIDKGVIAYL